MKRFAILSSLPCLICCSLVWFPSCGPKPRVDVPEPHRSKSTLRLDLVRIISRASLEPFGNDANAVPVIQFAHLNMTFDKTARTFRLSEPLRQKRSCLVVPISQGTTWQSRASLESVSSKGSVIEIRSTVRSPRIGSPAMPPPLFVRIYIEFE